MTDTDRAALAHALAGSAQGLLDHMARLHAAVSAALDVAEQHASLSADARLRQGYAGQARAYRRVLRWLEKPETLENVTPAGGATTEVNDNEGGQRQ